MKKIVKIALICLAVGVTITAFVLLNFTKLGLVQLNSLNGNQGMFDTMFGYTAQEAYRIMYVMGDAGIRQHLVMHLIDYGFIIGYFICMILAAYPFLKEKYQIFAVLVPTALVFADLIENITMDVALLDYLKTYNRNDSLVATSNVFSWIKWAMLLVWVGFFVTIVSIWLINKNKAKKAIV